MAEGEGGGGGAAYVYVCVDGVYACAYTRMHVLHRKYQCSYNIIGTYTQHANSHRTLSGSLTGWTETEGFTQLYSTHRSHAAQVTHSAGITHRGLRCWEHEDIAPLGREEGRYCHYSLSLLTS